MVRFAVAVVAVVVALGSTGSGFAVEPARAKSDRGPPPAAPKPSAPATGPTTTTAAFGDWVVACRSVPAEGKTRSVCAMSQRLRKSEDGADLALYRLTIGQTETDLHVSVVVPANVTVAEGVRLERDGGKDAAEALAWKTCAVGGCVAEADLTAARWRSLLTQPKQGIRLSYRDAAGRTVALPLSIAGSDEALTALVRLRSPH